MSPPLKGSAFWKPPKKADKQGRWFARVTVAKGQRATFFLFNGPKSPQARALADERAAYLTERAQREKVEVVPKRGKKAQALRAEAVETEAEKWWSRFFELRKARGLSHTPEGSYRAHVAPSFLGKKPWAAVTKEDIERFRDELDAKSRERLFSAKTAFNVWSLIVTASKAACGLWVKDKAKTLKVREDHVAAGVLPPDEDDDKELQWLWPSELAALLACEAVPFDFRCLYAFGAYLGARAGELKALQWVDIDVERGVVAIRKKYDRRSGEVRAGTKTGGKAASASSPTCSRCSAP